MTESAVPSGNEMRFAALAVGLFLVGSTAFLGAGSAHPGSVRPGRSLMMRDVGVLGGGQYSTGLSGGVIAFDGYASIGLGWPWEHPLYIHRVLANETVATGEIGLLVCFAYPWAILRQHEANHGDLNGDGDVRDWSHVAYDVETGETVRFGTGARVVPPCTGGGAVAYARAESDDGVDLNGDGDTADTFGFVLDLPTGRETALGLTDLPFSPMVFGRHVVWACPAPLPDWDICLRDMEAGAVQSAGLPGLRFGLPSTVAGDDELVAFVPQFSDGLAVVPLASGRLVADAVPGVAGTFELDVSHGKVYGVYGYGRPKAGVQFVYDVATNRTTDLPGPNRWPVVGPYNVHIHASVLVGNGWGGAQIPETPPGFPSNVTAYDLETGTSWVTGLHGFLAEQMRCFDGDTIVATADERVIGRDLNGDGDLYDPVVVYATTGEGPPSVETPAGGRVGGDLTALAGAVALIVVVAVARRRALLPPDSRANPYGPPDRSRRHVPRRPAHETLRGRDRRRRRGP
ncbi:MAG TPA: hypothetical protein VEM95_04565 [Thermoplasmata archaeon]|nr:hypothetical protein [Thermoplasmata archaeon]